MEIIKKPFSSYDRSLYYFNKCGDLLVFSIGIIEGDELLILKKDVFKKVAFFLMKRHPFLRANILTDQEKNLFFNINAHLADCDCEDDLLFFHLNSRDELQSYLEEFTKKKLDYEKKLWRMIIFDFNENGKKKYGISFWLPLFITDGLNITALQIEIANILNSLVSNTECKEMIVPLSVTENMFEITNRKNLIGKDQLKNIEEINKIKTSKFKFDPIFKSENERGCKIKFFNFTEIESNKLISLSKQNGTRFTAFIMTCFYYSIQQLYKENNLSDPVDIKFGVAANLRIRLDPILDFNNIGYFSCLVPINTVYPKFGKYENFFDDAKYLDGIIQEFTSVESGAIFNESHNFSATSETNDMFEKTSNIQDFCSILSSNSTWDVVISNVGTYLNKYKHQNPKGSLLLKEIYFTDTQNSYPSIDAAILIHLITWNNQLMFMISMGIVKKTQLQWSRPKTEPSASPYRTKRTEKKIRK
ncbi:hypothetical protein BpHYR1_015431, partial [Brachionus plicatilis]